MLGCKVLRGDPSWDWLSCVSWRSKGNQRVGVEHPWVESGHCGQNIWLVLTDQCLAAARVLCLSDSLCSMLRKRRMHSTCALHSKTN